MFTCKRCGYETLLKTNLIIHLKSKKPCRPTISDISRETLINELTQKVPTDSIIKCTFCSNTFNSRSTLCRHKKVCQLNPNNNKNNEIENIVRKFTNEIQNLKTEIEDLKNTQNNQSVNQQNTSTPTNQNCGNNNTINSNNKIINNINVVIRNFGNENMEALPKETIGDYFLNLQFKDLLEILHYHPDYPENKNIRIKSLKRQVLEIYKNNQWNVTTFMDGLNEIVLQAQQIFEDYYKKNKNTIADEMTKEELISRIKLLDDIKELDQKYVKPIHKDLQIMLENYRNNDATLTIDNN